MKHFHFSINQQLQNYLDILAGKRNATLYYRTERPIFGKKHSEGVHHTVLCNGICILMCIWHARIELVVRIFTMMRAKIVANFTDAIMCGTHKCTNAFFVGNIQNFNYSFDALKSHGLCARLLLGHMIHAKELIVAKKYSVHREFPVCINLQSVQLKRRESRLRSLATKLLGCNPTFEPLPGSNRIMATTLSASRAERNEFTPFVRC